MSAANWIQLIVYLGILFALAPFLGKFMARVYGDEKHILSFLKPLEKGIYGISGVDPQQEMNWKQYAAALLALNVLGFLFLYLLLVTQKWLPLNPAKIDNMSWHLALNTAVSFMTNTNWQNYGGENAASYLSQMGGLAVQNFLSAATGMAALLVLVRGIANRPKNGVARLGMNNVQLGNFWVDLTRSILYILLPLSLILAVLLMSQGVIQTFAGPVHAVTLEGKDQVITLGPAASQIAIKELGTNGGGFFNANSAHPFENATPLSNLFEMLALLLIPMATPFAYGRMVRDRSQGYSLFAAKTVLFALGLIVILFAEYGFNGMTGGHGTLEGRETRFGIAGSALWAEATTVTSNGSVNSMHDSFSPLGGMVPLTNILLGEIIYGGVGCGMYGMLVFLFITVFIAGLMVGRTPEYLGKKIESREMQLSVLAVVGQTCTVLFLAAAAVATKTGLSSLSNQGPHGLSEILYVFGSSVGNNGSAFAGLNGNTIFYNTLGAFAMLVGRFVLVIPVFAIAGSLGAKIPIPASIGTFATNNTIFVVLLVVTIIIIAGLNFFPALTLGPIVEHYLALKGMVF
ncbi:MAG TPA: potassium-transporting ATPase subunit KdpA [Spirochaetia bacterium]|nr:potassium-transporting ATPase subunit KdpA [Spirochaetia bacterium]